MSLERSQFSFWISLLRRARKIFAASDGMGFDSLIAYLSATPPKPPLRWMFTHNAGDGKLYYTYHDMTPENDYRFAYRDTCIKVTPLYEAMPDPWKDAVTDACTINCIGWDDNDPRKTLVKLLAWVEDVALDPTVSLRAAQLMEGEEPSALSPLEPTIRVLATGNAASPDAPGDYRPDIEPGTAWLHHTGRKYTVILIANGSSERDKFPPTVVYEGPNGKTWSRPVSDWHRSFTKL